MIIPMITGLLLLLMLFVSVNPLVPVLGWWDDYGGDMNPASKRYPHLSPAKAQARLEAVEWLVGRGYSEEECDAMSLKEMDRLIAKLSERDE